MFTFAGSAAAARTSQTSMNPLQKTMAQLTKAKQALARIKKEEVKDAKLKEGKEAKLSSSASLPGSLPASNELRAPLLSSYEQRQVSHLQRKRRVLERQARTSELQTLRPADVQKDLAILVKEFYTRLSACKVLLVSVLCITMSLIDDVVLFSCS
jgi:hypothetical protein